LSADFSFIRFYSPLTRGLEKLSDENVAVGGAAAAKMLIYKSPTIFERRRRILHEARVMISELGYENFSIRELARRADVAQRTLYNAFGSRENIVTNAIFQYSKEFSDNVTYTYPPHVLKGRLERTIKVHSRNLQIRPYTTAIMAVYNAHSSDPTIRQAIRKLSNDGLMPFAELLSAGKQLVDGVTPISFADHMTTIVYATLSSWCVGEIPDDEMVERIVEAYLMVLLSSTRGAMKKEAQCWLNELRARSPTWVELRAEAAAPRTLKRAKRSSRQT
jgi:AcrR family transcriptional regulator